MEEKTKTIQITLTEEKETLFVCLRAKALDSRQKNSILHDTKADEILKSIDYNFDKIEASASFDGDMPTTWRAKHFDDWTQEYIAANEHAVVVHLGCGLDSRITRVNPPATVSWFDVDYPEVIELRKNFFSESTQYKMIASSVTDSGWLQKIPSNRPVIIVAEGLLIYLDPDDVEELFHRIIDYFPHGQIVFDAMSKSIIKLGQKEVKKQTGAVLKWGVNDTKEIDRFSPKLKKISEMPLIKSIYIKQVPFGLFKIFCRVIAVFPFSRRAIRLNRYEF